VGLSEIFDFAKAGRSPIFRNIERGRLVGGPRAFARAELSRSPSEIFDF